ncbi:acyltransferase [Actinobacillus equuli subsp. haemolyticus]|uniref:acyltransferase family protein n=1 Tax=Actinobacillus equuli TaxID=718 RepID=UPI00244114F4|nr:acyltransferase [Actinobacillus equuli]WGE67133.1 acyltransferase [Actinobacillus equuli subsp. haemolyticus]WGE71455.1 acyltransferase [Actinobacillus equuli subsp. haemolyticus]
MEKQFKPRLDALDGLRGILAITVMVSHLVGSIIGWTDDRPFIGAYLSVIYFFMMSGFVLSYAHNKNENFVSYFLTRLARLLPLHIISTIGIITIFYYNSLHGGYFPNEDVFKISIIIKNLAFLNGVYPNDFYIINAPSWSISIEFWCSLLIPLVYNRINLFLKFILFVVIFVSMIYLYPNGFQKSMLIASLSMLVGSICFELSQKKYILKHLTEKNFLAFMFFALLSCFLGIYVENHTKADFLYFLLFIPLLFIDFTPDEFFLRRLLASKVFTFLGFISFPLYLLHELVIVSGIVFRNSPIVSMFIGGVVSICLAYIYARYFDVFIYKFFKNYIRKKFL